MGCQLQRASQLAELLGEYPVPVSSAPAEKSGMLSTREPEDKQSQSPRARSKGFLAMASFLTTSKRRGSMPEPHEL